MLDRVSLLFEDGGRPLARYRLAFPQVEYEGSLSVKEMRAGPMRRTALAARLLGANGAEVLPTLYDARLVYHADGESRIAGLQLDTLTNKFTAQTWHVKYGGYESR